MANTYTQIHIHLVFAVKYRRCSIDESWSEELYRYLTGIIKNHNHRVLGINGMPDHLHLLIGLRPAQSLSDLMRHVKGDTSEWINKNKLTKEKFAWQAGFGAFSYSKSQVSDVIRYIQKQKEYHQQKTFIDISL